MYHACSIYRHRYIKLTNYTSKTYPNVFQGAWLEHEKLGGYLFYALNYDDFEGDACGNGRYPLLKALVKGIKFGSGEKRPVKADSGV